VIALRDFARKLLREEGGATMVEFALVLTLLSMVAIGGFTFIRYYASRQIQTTGVRMTNQSSITPP
jgi:Flp pilus assembly pilin Flp